MKDMRNRFDAMDQILTPSAREVVEKINEDFFNVKQREWLQMLRDAGADNGTEYLWLAHTLLCSGTWMLISVGMPSSDAELLMESMFDWHTNPKFAAHVESAVADKDDFKEAVKGITEHFAADHAQRWAKTKAAN